MGLPESLNSFKIGLAI